jgi:hypothetical protein
MSPTLRSSSFFCLLCWLGILPFYTAAQIFIEEKECGNDSRLWLGFQYEHQFSKSWKLGTTIQTRLHQHFSMLQRNLAEVELSLNPRKVQVLRPITMRLGFRLFGVNDNKGKKKGTRIGFRSYGAVLYKKEVKRWTFEYRLMYQDQRGIPRQYLLETEWRRQKTLRNRFAIGYNIKKWKLDPTFKAELFYQINPGDFQGFNSYRLSLETGYKNSKLHKIKLRFLYEQTISAPCVQRDFILVLNYQLSTKTKKKKKKNK